MFKLPYLHLLDGPVKKVITWEFLGDLYVVKYESWGFISDDGYQPLVHEGKGVYRARKDHTYLFWGDKDACIKLQKGEKVKLFENGSYKLLNKKK